MRQVATGACPRAPARPRWGGPGWPDAIALAAVLAAAALVQAWPQAQAALEFRRAGIAAGQWWRLLSGSLVHFSWPNLASNLLGFALICRVARWRGLGVGWMLPPLAAAVGAGVYLFAPGVAAYRGLSGVSCGLLAVVLVSMAVRSRTRASIACLAVLSLMAGRFVFEGATGRALLPTSLPDGPVVVGAAHLAGMAAGSALAAGRALAGAAAKWAARARQTPGRRGGVLIYE